ncbi:ABC transporter substrate-binding protein [Acidobacteria bacterium AH-259-D05]|nr:ABC transporter substrate-binding protein [Acidobacteria bacterium AH-259-D05]
MKICSLLPSGTEILFALGLGEQVVGVTDLCNYPPEAKKKRVVCRSRVDPTHLSSAEVERRIQQILQAGESPFLLDANWLRTEQPELILTQDLCYVCDLDASQLMELSSLLRPQPQILILSPKTLSDIFDNTKKVGEATGALAKAEELVKELRERVDAVASKAAAASYKPRVLSLEGIDPLVAGGHWLPEMKVLAGGRDGLFSPGCPAQRIAWKTVLNSAAEVLVIDLCSSDIGRSLREISSLVRKEGWWELPAVEKGEVYAIDHVYYSTPGPRVVKGLEILAQVLHPELFTGMIPPDTAVKLDPLAARGCPDDKVASHFYPYP